MGKEVLNDNSENVQKRKKIYGKKDDDRRSLDVDDGGKVISWYSSIVKLISEHGMWKMLQALGLIVISVFFLMFANALNNEEIIEQWLIKNDDVHTEGTNIRNEVSPKVNNVLLKMMYELNADRVSVLEMHNGKENPTSLPFIYCDMTYEHTRDRIPYVSDEYEDLNMAKFTFPYYLYEHKLFIGSVEEIYTIDKRLAMRLEMNNVKYVAIIYVRGSNDIGFLMVSYMDVPNVSNERIHDAMIYYVQEVGSYLDYDVQHRKKYRE